MNEIRSNGTYLQVTIESARVDAEYAKQLGKEVESLTEEQKRQAFVTLIGRYMPRGNNENPQNR